jgi:hypothetical protein
MLVWKRNQVQEVPRPITRTELPFGASDGLRRASGTWSNLLLLGVVCDIDVFLARCIVRSAGRDVFAVCVRVRYFPRVGWRLRDMIQQWIQMVVSVSGSVVRCVDKCLIMSWTSVTGRRVWWRAWRVSAGFACLSMGW